MKLSSVFYQGSVTFLVSSVHIVGVYLVLESHVCSILIQEDSEWLIFKKINNCPASAQRKMFGENDSVILPRDTLQQLPLTGLGSHPGMRVG